MSRWPFPVTFGGLQAIKSMEMDLQMKQLLDWFSENGGELHSSVKLEHNDDYGYHFLATSDLPEDTPVCKCPPGLTISILNCCSSPPDGVRPCTGESICKHLIGKAANNVVAVFYLVEEWLKGKESFWHPYISLLPRPDSMNMPLWFGEEDLTWLKGTNMYSTGTPGEKTAIGLRREMYNDAWQHGLSILRSHNVDISPYTWYSNTAGLNSADYSRERILWAASVYSSRSFSSIILPFQTAISESLTSSETFPILYPVIDIFNHVVASKVSWIISENTPLQPGGSFSLILNTAIPKGAQVFNNYAPKGNEELLMGYGFCLDPNPCDQLSMRLAKPPEPALRILCERYPRLFGVEISKNGWTDNVGAYYLRSSDHFAGGHENALGLKCLRGIPIGLFLALQTLVEVTMPEDAVEGESEEEVQERLWCSTLDIILQRLEHKRAMIAYFDPELPETPKNAKQKAAKIYRDGQVRILDEITREIGEVLEPIESGESSMNETFEETWEKWRLLLKEEQTATEQSGD